MAEQTNEQTPKLKITGIVILLYKTDKKRKMEKKITNVQTHLLHRFIYIVYTVDVDFQNQIRGATVPKNQWRLKRLLRDSNAGAFWLDKRI